MVLTTPSRAPKPPLADARVAIVHDWLETPGGAELVLEELIGLFPRADLFTMIDKRSPATGAASLAGVKINTSWLQHVPGIKRSYRSWLPIMPLALRSLDVSGYDIVISNSHAVAKGIRTGAGQLHLCYCLSPMRYAWDLKGQYLREAKLDRGIMGILASALLDRMRQWDLENTSGVTAFATVSNHIADRITRAYGRASEVIYPPVDTDYFTPGDPSLPRGDAYVTASRFVPYKRLDMIAKAFRLLPDRKLIIVGDGPDEAKVRAAAGSNVMLVGRESRERVRERLRGARAFLFAAEEDFGIAPVEAQACGTPVIAFGLGGVRETVRGLDDSAPSGVFYDAQTPESLAGGVRRFEELARPISPSACRANALRFSVDDFRKRMQAFVVRGWAGFDKKGHSGNG